MATSKQLETIHKAIIVIHRKFFGESPSPMKLQKLCYYAQGYALAEGEGHELFSEDFQAWQHGPVIAELYAQYKDYQWRQISDQIDASEINLDNSVYSLLENIVSAYGRYDGAALSTMTHREQPWLEARGNLDELAGCQEVISKVSLGHFFAAKLKQYD